MSKLLKFLLMSAIPMYAEGASGGGVADTDDHHLDDDDNDDVVDTNSEKKDEPTDGSVDVEVDDDKSEEVGETDDAREKIRESRRQERQERKQRNKEREESTKRELSAERSARKALEDRLAAIEGKDKSREIAQVDETIKKAQNAYNFQKERLQQAHEQHDGATAADATEKMMAARDAYGNLTRIKEGFQKSQNTPANLDDRLVTNAQKFMAENNWYKPGSGDQDTEIARVLDNKLAEEGWDPKTPEYWQELRQRIKKVLPHRISGGKVVTSDADDAPKKQKSVVSGSGGEGQAPGSKGTFRVSPERVSAMKEAGVWNDPKKRAEMISEYRAYDKANKKG
jgi:hypothetical protein